MVGGGMEDVAVSKDCKFPNVSKTFWRSATWSSHSAPTVPLTPCSQQKLPVPHPLSITRRSLEEWPRAGSDDVEDWTPPVTPGRRQGIKCGPDIKLDLSSVQRIEEPTEIQLKRDKLAFFDKECSRVTEHIYLGSDAVAKNKETLKANCITHVLNCVGFACPEYFKDDFVYKTLWLHDSPSEDITSLLYDVFDYFEEVREHGGRVFVHCCQGVSRSTSLVIAYLMWHNGRSFEDAFQDVKAARGVTNPNMGFMCQLLQCQKRVHAAPISPNSELRMYRLAPHSPYDPLHLVPKTVSKPGSAALDSRGAFVIHVPVAIYIWVGLMCHPRIAQAARRVADQLIRYEKAEGEVIFCNEGEEINAFWEALRKLSSSGKCDKAECDNLEREPTNEDVNWDVQGERVWATGGKQIKEGRCQGCRMKRVISYDVDFELYLRASHGGVVPPVRSTGAGRIPTHLPAREDGWSWLHQKPSSEKELVAAAKTAGNLVHSGTEPGEEKHCLNKQQNNMPSPALSMISSSPQISPFASPFSVSSPSLSPVSDKLPSTTAIPSFVANLNTSYSVEHLPVDPQIKAIPQCSSNSSSMSLAQRRGKKFPLHLPVPALDTIIAPRGRHPFSWKNEAEKSEMGTWREGKDELLYRVDDFDGLSFDLDDAPGNRLKEVKVKEHLQKGLMGGDQEFAGSDTVRQIMSCPSKITGQGILIKESVSEVELPVLYEWPGMKKIFMFDTDDLNSQTAYILIAADSVCGDGIHGEIVYVWVGKELMNGSEGAECKVDWQEIGRTAIEEIQLSKGVPVKVINEGQEPEEFWNIFIHG